MRLRDAEKSVGSSKCTADRGDEVVRALMTPRSSSQRRFFGAMATT
jgi:hypothetical protein